MVSDPSQQLGGNYDLKCLMAQQESNPVKAVEYAIATGLAKEPEFMGGYYACCASMIAPSKRCNHSTGNVLISMGLNYLTALRKP